MLTTHGVHEQEEEPAIGMQGCMEADLLSGVLAVNTAARCRCMHACKPIPEGCEYIGEKYLANAGQHHVNDCLHENPSPRDIGTWSRTFSGVIF